MKTISLLKTTILAICLCIFCACDKEDTTNAKGILNYDGQDYKVDNVYMEIQNSSDYKCLVNLTIPTEGINWDQETNDFADDPGSGFIMYLQIPLSEASDFLPAGTYHYEGDYWDELVAFPTEDVWSFGYETLNVERNGNYYTFHFEGTLDNGKQVTMDWSGEPEISNE